jgi:dipeptidase E
MSSVFILSGGGDSEQAVKTDTYLQSVTASIGSLHCLYIPLALEKEYHQDALRWFTSTYDYISHIDMISDELDAARCIKKQYELIYIGGGSTGRLLYTLVDYIADQFKKGVIVYGGSAGAIILGKTITVAPEQEFEADRSNVGFNVLGNTSVVPHFSGTFTRRQKAEAMEHDSGLIGISESSGIVFENGCVSTKFNPVGIALY